MLATLAASDHSLERLCQAVTDMFSSPDALAQPQVLLSSIDQISIVWAVLFLIAGLLCLLNGYKFSKTAVVGMALLFGLFAGYWLGVRIHAPAMIVAACVSALLAVSAFPLMKYAVAIFGGLAGAFIGANMWAGVSDALNRANGMNFSPDAFWIGALIGLLVCGMLAFILFDLSIVLFTSVSGSTLAVLGALALTASVMGPETLRRNIGDSRLVIPLLVFVPAFIGLVLQQFWAKGSPAPSGGGKPAKA